MLCFIIISNVISIIVMSYSLNNCSLPFSISYKKVFIKPMHTILVKSMSTLTLYDTLANSYSCLCNDSKSFHNREVWVAIIIYICLFHVFSLIYSCTNWIVIQHWKMTGISVE